MFSTTEKHATSMVVIAALSPATPSLVQLLTLNDATHPQWTAKIQTTIKEESKLDDARFHDRFLQQIMGVVAFFFAFSETQK